VRRVHGLGDDEKLLGWLYVGGVIPERVKPERDAVDPTDYVSVL
jgi:hypothetical protein